MAAGFDTWESYFYPPPDDQTLRNLFDERDPVVLSRLEYAETAERQRELMAGELAIPQTYDAAHVRGIHRHLFQDVYEWAGEYRTVDMAKGRRGFFATVEGHPSGIEAALARASEAARSTDWQRADRATFARGMAEVFAWTNHAHFAREGNGRTTKVFLSQIAEQSKFSLDFGDISPLGWNVLSDASRPREGQATTNPEMMTELFENIAVERPTRPTTPPFSANPVWRVSYPQSPTQATQRGTDTPETGPGPGSPYDPGRGYGTAGRGEGR